MFFKWYFLSAEVFFVLLHTTNCVCSLLGVNGSQMITLTPRLSTLDY